MTYLVMETHPAYAVVLDEEGRFLKAANLGYQVGDTVGDIVALQTPRAAHTAYRRPLAGLAAMAACFCLVFFGWYQPNYTAYGTLRIQINPDVEMTLSRTDRVLELEGLNQDGRDLIDGYHFQGKDREEATDELLERAIDMGYLSDGDTVSVTVSSGDGSWQAREEQAVQTQLEERYGQTIVIAMGGQDQTEQTPGSSGSSGSSPEVTIPVTPPDDTDYGPNADGVTDYEDTDYGPDADGVTDYDDTDYGPNADGVTDYDDTDYGPNADGVTDYDDTDYGPNADGVTDYDDDDDGVTDYDDDDDGVTDYDDDDDDDDDDWDD